MQLVCKYCGSKFIRPLKNINRSKNHFCSLRCAVTFNNINRPKKSKTKKCKCGNTIFIRATYCKQCDPRFVDWSKRTLKDLNKFGNYNKHRYLRDNSLREYRNKCNINSCLICGYDKHIDVSHIKAVSKFDVNTPISKINNINNMVPLCKNHHWEFDHGLIDKKVIIKKWRKFGYIS
ncbi:HNH endonuclease [Candidatus Pacearchaeota archaeon]|nr:HNH endonuclease [Candidatus Pacearchaeota archaeon]